MTGITGRSRLVGRVPRGLVSRESVRAGDAGGVPAPRRTLRLVSLPRPTLAAVGVCAALFAGVVLRTAWVRDMEYKGDEAWTFERVRHAGVDEPIPALGMPTSYEVRHPGGTVWVFVAVARVCGAATPTDLGRACQVVNSLALVLVVGFAYRCVPAGEREAWLWGAALAAVNPLAVVFQRKIWPPSVVPLFTTLALVAWWHRGRRAGAFFWGLGSVLVGQIHPGGLFLAAGFVAWTFLMDRKSARWGYWAAGSAAAALTLVPWLRYAAAAPDPAAGSQRYWSNLVTARFWVNWLTEVNGVSLHYTLGDDFWDFLRHPVVGGSPTYGVALLHALMIGTGLAVYALAVRRAWRAGGRATAAEVAGRASPTGLAVACGLLGFGLAFTLTRLPVHRHYMNLTFPLMPVWLARVALMNREPLRGPLTRGRALLLAACLLQSAVSAGFLGYVHANQRAIRGDYGTPYGAQPAAARPPL